MRAKRIPLGEWLRSAQENIGAVLFLLGLVTAGCGLVVTFAAKWVDYRVTLRTEPIREILVWKLDRDGDLEEYMRDKAGRDSLSRATDPRSSVAPASSTWTLTRRTP